MFVARTNTSAFSGFLPVRKPKNVSINKLLYGLRDDFNYANQELQNRQHSFANISYSRYLEFFSTGLVTFIFGHCNHYRRNFVVSEYKYRITVEFGVEREFCSIDGKLISQQDTSHINRDLIEESIKSFIGTRIQKRIGNYSGKSICLESKSLSPSQDIFMSMQHVSPKPIAINVPQKYPKMEFARDQDCYSIELLEFNRPFATFEISCIGGFSPRAFTMDLAADLNTKMSLVEQERLQEGPMMLDDLRVIESYELQYDFYEKKVPAMRGWYSRYLHQFNDSFEIKE